MQIRLWPRQMKKSEFKKIIKEAVREVILESGFLSSIIQECMRGAMASVSSAPQQQIVETKREQQEKIIPKNNNRLNEMRKKASDAIGKDAYNGVNLFEGTTPLSNSSAAAASPQQQANSPMTGIAPEDAGIPLEIFGRAFKRN